MSAKISTRWRRFVGVATAATVLSGSGWILQARALDDGEAPLWTGLGDMVGPMLGGGEKEKDPIEYRERAKLVIPPKMELPKPGLGKASAAFPTDQEVQRAKKLKQLEDGPSTLPVGRKTVPIVPADGGTTVTMSATAGSGPAHAACLKDGVAVPCPDTDQKGGKSSGAQIDWNPLTWVGIQKKPDVVLGPEPPRDYLTDPPPGLRAPVEGVGAKVSNN
jgi:hypothetical protein